MHEIQLIIVKLLRILLVASLIPPLALLIIAAVNERVRRVVLWIMAPLAILSLSVYLFLAASGMTGAQDLPGAGEALKKGLQAAVPFLLGLLLLGVLAYLLGPALREKVEGGLRRSARREYLSALLEWLEPRVAGVVELEGRAPAAVLDSPAPQAGLSSPLDGAGTGHQRITGDAGSGKSTLMRSLLGEAARRALADDTRPLPIWIDLDELEPGGGLSTARLETALPVRTRFLGWLLQKEGQAHRLLFLVDGSVQTFGLTFAATGGAKVARAAAGKLARYVEALSPCPFILSMPPGVKNGTLDHLSEREISLLPLSEEGIRAGAQALAKDQAGPLSAALLSSGGVWSGLASRPVFLRLLAQFFAKNQRLPVDVRELFRVTLYPAKTPADQVEAALARLGEKILFTGQYEISLREWELNPGQKGASNPHAGSGRVARALEACGLVRLRAGEPVNGQPELKVGFTHPVYLAYGLALAWRSNQVSPLAAGPAEPLEVPPESAAELWEAASPVSFAESAGQAQDLESVWVRPGQAEILEADPVLADALIFFNNIEADPQRQADTLRALIEQGPAQDESSRFREFLAVQCLLAMPAANRPADLVQQIAARLIEEMPYDEEAVTQARLIMEPLDESARLSIYSWALANVDETHLEQTLRRILEAVADGSTPADTLRAMLWRGSPELSQRVGQVWAGCEPKEAAGLFQDLYERGPAERREMAIRLFGKLPADAAGAYLLELLKTEKDPSMRAAALRSLLACGAGTVPTLLGIVADRAETDELRVYAADHLERIGSQKLGSQELGSSGTVREIVRVSRIPMPDRAQASMQELLERLRAFAPKDTSQWEEVVNPYLVGRPVTDPQMFFGRAQLLRDLCLAVDNNTPVLLTGERRAGKTSLLYRLTAALEEESARGVPMRAVLFDLKGLQPHEFYETAIRALIEGLRDPQLFADPNVPRPYTDQHFSRDLADLLAHVQNTLSQRSRLAWLIDNADGFLDYPPAMHASLLRILSSASGLAVVLAGSDPLRGWQQPEPPFYSSFLRLDIPRLAPTEARQLVTEPVAGVFQYEEEALECILQAAQGRPAEIQALCHALVSQLLSLGERTITAGMAEEALRGSSPRTELLRQAETALGGMMDWLEAHPGAPAPQVEEQLKRAWSELQKAVVQQVSRVRKAKG